MSGLAYCIRCKQKTEVMEGNLVYYRNGTPVEKGKCKNCQSKVTRILRKEERAYIKESQKKTAEIPMPDSEDILDDTNE